MNDTLVLAVFMIFIPTKNETISLIVSVKAKKTDIAQSPIYKIENCINENIVSSEKNHFDLF